MSLMRTSVDVEKGKGEGEGYVMGPLGGMDSFLDKVSYAVHSASFVCSPFTTV